MWRDRYCKIGRSRRNRGHCTRVGWVRRSDRPPYCVHRLHPVTVGVAGRYRGIHVGYVARVVSRSAAWRSGRSCRTWLLVLPRCSARPQSRSRWSRCPSRSGSPAVRIGDGCRQEGRSCRHRRRRRGPDLNRPACWKQSRQTWWESRVNPDKLECRRLSLPIANTLYQYVVLLATVVSV